MGALAVIPLWGMVDPTTHFNNASNDPNNPIRVDRSKRSKFRNREPAVELMGALGVIATPASTTPMPPIEASPRSDSGEAVNSYREMGAMGAMRTHVHRSWPPDRHGPECQSREPSSDHFLPALVPSPPLGAVRAIRAEGTFSQSPQ